MKREIVAALVVLLCMLFSDNAEADDFSVTQRVVQNAGSAIEHHWFRFESTVMVMPHWDELKVAQRNMTLACRSKGWRAGPVDQVKVLKKGGVKSGVPTWRYTGLCHGYVSTNGLYR